MPTSTALLIIDVQRALCSGPEAAFAIDGVLDRINGLGREARAAGAPVVVIQHEDEEALRFDTPGWQLADGLVIASEDLRIHKRTPNSFHNTPLHALLQDRQVDRLVICGLQTDFCVDTTVRQALPLGYRVVLAADAHSTIDGALSAADIIAHHNHTFRHMTSFGPVLAVTPAADITFRDG
jgi:nicotinamidase-related amidase